MLSMLVEICDTILWYPRHKTSYSRHNASASSQALWLQNQKVYTLIRQPKITTLQYKYDCMPSHIKDVSSYSLVQRRGFINSWLHILVIFSLLTSLITSIQQKLENIMARILNKADATTHVILEGFWTCTNMLFGNMLLSSGHVRTCYSRRILQ
jgi:hypothetical protein